MFLPTLLPQQLKKELPAKAALYVPVLVHRHLISTDKGKCKSVLRIHGQLLQDPGPQSLVELRRCLVHVSELIDKSP